MAGKKEMKNEIIEKEDNSAGNSEGTPAASNARRYACIWQRAIIVYVYAYIVNILLFGLPKRAIHACTCVWFFCT